MSVSVKIPTPLRKLAAGKSEVVVEGKTIKEVLENLEKGNPGIRERIFNEDGNLKRFVNVYLNENDVRTMENLSTKVKSGDSVAIVPAIAGGRP